MGQIQRIGLLGLTGVGKTTVAEHLRAVHHFQICSTGAMCRAVSKLVFGNEEKANLFALTDALQALDPAIFLKAALRNVSTGAPIVIDAIRYAHDYDYAQVNDFFLIRVVASEIHRRKWLQARGQTFDFRKDTTHKSETALRDASVSAVLNNDGSRDRLLETVDALLKENGRDKT